MAPTAPSMPIPTDLMFTPWVHPASCTNIFSASELTFYSTVYNYTTFTHTIGTSLSESTSTSTSSYPLSTLNVTFSNPLDSHFSTCQPPGWDRTRIESSYFTFAPAVCPSGWVAYGMRPENVYDHDWGYSAYCCSSGYTFDSESWGATLPYYHPSYRCLSTLPSSTTGIASTSATTTSDGSSISSPTSPDVLTVTSTFNFSPTVSRTSSTSRESTLTTTTTKPSLSDLETIKVHAAYAISWDRGDISKLSPPPPSLSCDETIATWTPGEAIPTALLNCSNSYDSNLKSYRGGSDGGWTSLILFLMIGVPIIGGVIIFGCCCLCCYRSNTYRARRKEREAKKLGASPAPAGVDEGLELKEGLGRAGSGNETAIAQWREAVAAAAVIDAEERNREDAAGGPPIGVSLEMAKNGEDDEARRLVPRGSTEVSAQRTEPKKG